MLDNKAWQLELQNVSKDLQNCQFPRESEIGIHGDRDHVVITLHRKGLHANMQTDAAAFEAWALTLLCHCEVKTVAITLQENSGQLDVQEPHFQRFLYRLTRFVELFPGRIVADERLLKLSRVAGGALGLFYLNQPLNHRSPIEAEREERLRVFLSQPGDHSESDLERALEISPAFIDALALEKVMRQWPVGLFGERVAHGNRIFTGGKSAIDLMGIRNEELVLVELKKDGNRKVGAISELFFYSSLMRDALGGIFKFEERPSKRNCAVTTEDIRRCSSVCAVLLAPKMHPLIENPRIISDLNSALARHWLKFPVKFDKVHIRSSPKNIGEDFIFS
ncbi:hypothetical protein JQ597_25385 [Bradyrhizobium sp. AUGA SZCCT0177]|uniref:hypothetical protein n=1 Tax=Bradyrhizobium sp. AUGA SZCCT0177 TaxID=2807665 RepID=UPI001BA66380|nr:hypothetical protein [Bradyrhizobium sp. AUGA SZCCT0177]MBR1285388.1 hypothetical protein [Bradyrhizobium sp. AUGA SZCCT0177]